MAQMKLIYVGIKGAVLALEKASGSRVWETKLKGDSYTTVLVDGGRVFAGARGEVFCLDAATGRILWHDPLTGFGWGLVSLATDTACSSPTSTEELRRREAAAAAASSSAAAT
jgi:outer membrane protein assembly factor BamB